ncbi:MAG: tannase/feruloyl esterase family alpha/beta hydrolase [Actinomycetota bacterium]|nr:tannase/feruloyl esterase family alpha/beta hydrolase [Actinomycetota bacterium]
MTVSLGGLETASYRVTDPYFGAPYIDEDVHVEQPVPHRVVHGGFENTDTRFTCYFPDDGYEGRLFQPIEGGHGGHERSFAPSNLGDLEFERVGVRMLNRLGGYMVESNQGHIGDDIDQRAGDDPRMYGYRASAESARFSKHVAAQIYGAPPHHAYVFGGSGGGRRSPLCLENAPDVYDGALPYMGGGDIAPLGSTARIRGSQVMSFASMFNVQRILGPKVLDITDAMAPGGSGDPFTGLDTHQREELASLYRQGFPIGDEFIISQPFGQIWLWTSIADMLYEQDPSYFECFWSRPGYVGHDHPHLVQPDVIDTVATVRRVLTAKELATLEGYEGAEFITLRNLAVIMATMSGDWELPVAVELDGVGSGYRLGTGVKVLSGPAAGRQLYASGVSGDLFSCDGPAEANIERFRGVSAGDTVQVDNRRFLAFCYFARHHLMEDEQFDSLRVDGVPMFPQHPVPLMSPLMGVSYSGQLQGKLIWVHHTHDASLWPPQGVIYEQAARAALGDAVDDHFCLRWTHNAEHMPPLMIPSLPNRNAATWLIDSQSIIEQSLLDLVAWVEQGVRPTATNYTYSGGQVSLPASAAERGGIQPVVMVTANGGSRADAAVGEPVTVTVVCEVPPGAGSIVAIDWDVDGSGTFPLHEEGIDGSSAGVERSITRTFDAPGTYFVTAKVWSHRDGDVNARHRRLPNLAQARVVVQ